MLRDAFTELGKNDPLRMAGATAFFTTFALPPILIIIIQLLGLVFDGRMMAHQLFKRLGSIIGRDSMHQVITTLIAFRKLAQNWVITIGGSIFLVFIATTLFTIIKGSLNQVWRIKPVKKRSLLVRLRSRLQSVFVILITGVLFLTTLLVETAQAFLGRHIHQFSPGVVFFFTSGLNFMLSVGIDTVWFALLFRFLPDGRPRWKVAFIGALLTSVFFNSGKILLRWLLINSNIDTVYGASGSIVLLLLFVFYCSLILYYGAAFTMVWASYHDQPIKPLPHAMHYKLSNIKEQEKLAN
jgi:membrane protein